MLINYTSLYFLFISQSFFLVTGLPYKLFHNEGLYLICIRILYCK